MAPSTRSQSANNTPAKNSGTVATRIDAVATPPRKEHRCTKCNRPRAGHPRSGCPFVTPDGDNVQTNSRNLTTALSSMTIANDEDEPSLTETPVRRKGRRSMVPPPPAIPTEFEDLKKVLRERRKSERAAASPRTKLLPSLSPSDLELLLLPGDNGSDDGQDPDARDENTKKVVHWKERIELLSIGGTVSTRAFEKGRAKMPGTLVTPWSSFNASVSGDYKNGFTNTVPDSLSQTSSTSVTSNDTALSVEVVSPSLSAGPRPLARTMSMEERAGFMQHLEEISTTKAYVLTGADIAQLEGKTPKGVYSKVLKIDDGSEEGRNVLVVGRDEEETEKLFRDLAPKQMPQKRVVDMKTAAGGAVVGAVATWTGLAFS